MFSGPRIEISSTEILSGAPERISVEEISIRGPENISEPSDEEKVILKRWFNTESIKIPEIRFRETYFHNDTHPLSHLSINQKWDACIPFLIDREMG